MERDPHTPGTRNQPSGLDARSPSQSWVPEKKKRRSRFAWLRAALCLPAPLLPLLPSANCPLCLTAYAGILSTLGLGFLFTECVLSHLVVVFLLVGIGSIAWTLPAHGQRSPLLLAIIASALIVCGRLIWSAPLLVYFGAPMFLIAAGWNFWQRVKVNRKEQPA